MSSAFKGYMKGQLLKQRRRGFLDIQGPRKPFKYFGQDIAMLWYVSSLSAAR